MGGGYRGGAIAVALWALVPSGVAGQPPPPVQPVHGQGPEAAEGAPHGELAPPAEAEVAQRQPTPFALRPLVLPRATVRIDSTFRITTEARDTLDRQSHVSFLGVVGFWVADGVELGVQVLPLSLAPEPAYDDPGVYGLLRLFGSDGVELGLQLDATVPVREDSAFGSTFSLRLLWRVVDRFRIDTGATFAAVFHDPVRTSLLLPLAGTLQLTDAFFVGARTGLDLVYLSGADERDGRKRDALVPAGLFVGGTLRGEQGPFADLRMGVHLPSVTDGFERWQLALGGVFHFY